MCGRFSLKTKAESLAEWFQVPVLPFIEPRYNIHPASQVLVVRQLPDLPARELVPLRWGLIPSWAKDAAAGDRLANARAESAASKASFRDSFRKRRCLVPADGFYEWKRVERGKEPYYISLREGQPFAFAGLWDRWHIAGGQPIESCTILTTRPNDLLRPIHDRMPVIVDRANYAAWLDPQFHEPRTLEPILAPYPSEQMTAYQVTRRVNNPRYDGPECLTPAPEQAKQPTPPDSQGLLF